MPRTTPPFRADHVGSLLRPHELIAARAAHKAGRHAAEELRQAEDEAIRRVVRLQEEIGLQSVTDGEFRRSSWHMDFLYQVGGVEQAQETLKVRFHNEEGDIEFTPAALRIAAKLRLQRCIFGTDFAFLESVAKAIPKL